MTFLNPHLLHLALPAAIALAVALVGLHFWRRKVVQKRVGDWNLLSERRSRLPPAICCSSRLCGITAGLLLLRWLVHHSNATR